MTDEEKFQKLVETEYPKYTPEQVKEVIATIEQHIGSSTAIGHAVSIPCLDGSRRYILNPAQPGKFITKRYGTGKTNLYNLIKNGTVLNSNSTFDSLENLLEAVRCIMKVQTIMSNNELFKGTQHIEKLISSFRNNVLKINTYIDKYNHVHEMSKTLNSVLSSMMSKVNKLKYKLSETDENRIVQSIKDADSFEEAKQNYINSVEVYIKIFRMHQDVFGEILGLQASTSSAKARYEPILKNNSYEV
jgi:hypothetical protein